MWEGASVKEGQMRLPRGKLSCSCLLSCIPSGEAFFPTPGGGAALLRGYRLGEDRGTQGWGVAHKSSPGGGRHRMPVILMQGAILLQRRYELVGKLARAGTPTMQRGAATFMKYVNPESASPKAGNTVEKKKILDQTTQQIWEGCNFGNLTLLFCLNTSASSTFEWPGAVKSIV